MARQMIKRSRNNSLPIHSGMVMRISLILSLCFHVLIFLVFQKAFPLDWAVEELRTYSVELIRPPVEDINPDEISETDGAQTKPEQRAGPEDSQDTISLDTRDKRYAPYAKIIKEKILRHWRYPEEAMENLLEGKLLVIFSLVSEGNMTKAQIINTSGHQILDTEATRAIEAASPFPPFPEHITLNRLNIKASFVYRLTTRKSIRQAWD